MKIAKKLTALAVSSLMIFSVAGITASAATVTQDGLNVSLTTDKTEYKKDEAITATLTVENTGSASVKDVKLENVVPEGYELAKDYSLTKSVDELKSNDKAELKVVYNAKTGGNVTPSNNNTTTTNSTASTTASGASVDTVKTGDSTNAVVFAVILLISIGAGILCFKKKKGKDFLSIALCVSVLGTIIAVVPFEANAAESEFISVSTSIKINNINTILSAKVYHASNNNNAGNKDYGAIYYTPVDLDHIFAENELVKYSDNEVLIVVKDGITKNKVIDLVEKYDLSIVGEIEITGDYQLKSNKDISINELNGLISQIKNEEIIESVTLNYVQTYSDNQVEERNGFYYGKKWQGDLQNFNDAKGKSWGLEAIETLAAWDLLARDSDKVHPVKVGVVDGGFDSSHEDLSYVEILYENGQNGAYSASKDHGTHVTGTIAARNDTNVGICGVYPYGQNNVYAIAMGGNNAPGNGINTFEENGTFWNSIMGQKIAFAELIVRNIKVINQSQGFNWYQAKEFQKNILGLKYTDYDQVRDLFNPSNFTEMETESDALGDFLNRCLKKGYDFVIVSAAGNDSDSSIGHLESRFSNWNNLISQAKFPDVYNRIIVVGSVNNKFEIANSSNVGSRLDIFAPGTDIYSTTENSKYGKKSGTSMATPHVSGVAAMVWSANNDLTGVQVKEAICRRGSLRCKSCKMIDAYMAVEHAIDLRDTNIPEPPNSTKGMIMSFVVQKNNEDIRVNRAHIVVTNTKTNETYTADTDNDGHFEIIVPKGKYSITVSAENYRDYKSESIITVNGNDVVYSDWIKLTRLSYVYGTVKNTNNEIVDDVKVTLTDNENNTYGSKFTENGKYLFEIDYIASRRYTVKFEKTDYKTMSVTETDGGTDIEINARLEKEGLPKDKMYAAYLKEVQNIINECGEGKIGSENPNDNSRNAHIGSSYRISGLNYAELIDFDNDGTEELLCTYAPLTYNSEYNYYSCPQKIKIFGFDGSKANVIYEGNVTGYGAEPGSHIHYYVDTDMNTVLLTRKNPQTFTIEEWSKLENGEFKIVKSFSDMPDSNDINAGIDQAFRIDGKTVSKEQFNMELQNIRDKWTDIQLSDTTYGKAVSVIEATKNTLITLGYKFDNTISGNCGNDVSYNLDNNGVLTISGNGGMTDYNRYYESPFFGNQNVKKVIIENGVTSIGKNLFNSCHELTSIDIPDSVTSISSNAFWDCTSLKSIIMPDSITTIGDSVFNNCTSLEKAKVSESALNMGLFVFYKCSNLKEASLPSQLKSVPSRIFSDCSSLQNISIPDTVTNIGDGAFYYCESLQDITLPSGLYSIGEEAFEGCKSFTTMVIPSGVTYINKELFWSCDNLKNVTLHNDITTIDDSAFGYCKSLTNIQLPSKLTKIGMSAFSNCTGIISIRIPVSVSTIERNAFNAWTPDQTIYVEGKNYAPAGWEDTGYFSWNGYCNAKLVWNA